MSSEPPSRVTRPFILSAQHPEYSVSQSNVKALLGILIGRLESSSGAKTRASFERAAAPLTWSTICPIVRAPGGGATDGGTFGLAIVLGRRAFDLRQCAAQGCALSRHCGGHRVLCA